MAFYLADGDNFYNEQQNNVKEICGNKPDNVNIIFLHDRRRNNGDKSNLKDINYVSDCSGFINIPNLGTETYSTDTLKKFFGYVRQNYKSDRYFYSITAHGVPPYMNDRGSLNGLQIRDALKGIEPDVLGLDMCYMGSIETMLVLSGTAEYIVAASTTLPAAGNDFSIFTDYFGKHKDVAAKDAARAYLNGYRQSYRNKDLPLTVFITKTGEPLNRTAVLFSDRVKNLRIRPYNNLPENAVTLFGINGNFTDLLKALKIDYSDTFTEIYSENVSLKGVAVYFPARRNILDQTLYGYKLFLKQNSLSTRWADLLRLY